MSKAAALSFAGRRMHPIKPDTILTRCCLTATIPCISHQFPPLLWFISKLLHHAKLLLVVVVQIRVQRIGSAAPGRAEQCHDRDHGPPVPTMAPSDHGSEASDDALKRPASCACACSCDREAEEPTYHERKLSGSTTSFSSPAPSCASSSTDYHPAATKLSSESIPFAGPGGPDDHGLAKLSSTSSYESFFHIEASDFGTTGAGAEFLDFEPTSTLAPAVQTMKGGAPAAYDPKRLPSSMFRTRSTSPAEWSATSNESLFSIQLSSNSGDLSALYADLYYDAAGLPRFPSARKLSASSSARSGGLCVAHDCARCSGGGCSKTRKSVRFAATESISGECKHSVVVSTLEVAMEETTTAEARPGSATKAAAGGGWCELGCCLASPPKVWTWWPRCCSCVRQCKWWL